MSYIFRILQQEAWAQSLSYLAAACLSRDTGEVEAAYADLYATLAEAGHADLFEAVAAGLLYTESPLAARLEPDTPPPAGLLAGARRDLQMWLELLGRNWHADAADLVGARLPPLDCLNNPKQGPVTVLAQQLRTAVPDDANAADAILTALLEAYRRDGMGNLARFPAFRWSGGALHGVSQPTWAEAERLVGVEGALRRLRANTEAFLSSRGGHHTLLYGPRGSGKSTALRSLGGQYAEAGLRLIEVVPESLAELPRILDTVRGRPHHYLLFVDDLAFEAGSSAYGPLKSLLEGSLGGRPRNALVYATSNRRHLVSERFSERPDPLNEDVYAWDTQHEKLALADRFGLVITFPDATQRRYLEIVRSLAERDGVTAADLDLRAVRFADWGNGYSGRTAQQFLEALQSGLL